MDDLPYRRRGASYTVDTWLFHLKFFTLFVFVGLARAAIEPCLKFGEIVMGTLELALRYFKLLCASLLVFGELIVLELTVLELLL